MTEILRWHIGLSEALAQAHSVDDVLSELGQRLSESTASPVVAVLRRDGSSYRCLATRGVGALAPSALVSDAEVSAFLGAGTTLRSKSVRAVEDGDTVRIVVEIHGSPLEMPIARVGAVLLERKGILGGDELDSISLAVRIGELACAAAAASTSSPPAGGERTAEHWEAIGRLTSTVLHELGNPVAFAALAASQLAGLARTQPHGPMGSEQARTLADDLALSVRQMAELLAELRRVSRGPEGARYVEPRAVVEGAVRLAHAELRGVASITTEVGELPLVAGRAGSLGAGLAHLFSSVLRGNGGQLSVRGSVDGDNVVLVVEGFDFRMPRAADAVRIVRGLAMSAEGRAELDRQGALTIRIPTASDPAPASTRKGNERPRLLVIDDEAALARAMASALSQSFEVEIAVSADEALTRVEQRRFDVILCDLHLSGDSGLEFYDRLIARVPRLAHRFALTSGGVDAGTEDKARARGIPLLSKPFDWKELERQLSRLATAVVSEPPAST